MEHFNDLKEGKVGVKGGWRIYSSGPGIYLNQLISNCLGIRILNNNLILDPVLPNKLNGLSFTYKYEGKPIEVKYHIRDNKGVKKVVINNKEVTFKTLENKYRHAGVIVTKETLDVVFTPNLNIIEIYM
ncbi:MAG: cellobiose phosphorylase [Haloplasmataceae bacterium]|nr:cellobiose phosphorylase [Haloplasmataceae bacterium]